MSMSRDRHSKQFSEVSNCNTFCFSLHTLSHKLVLPPHKTIPAPPTAAERIAQNPTKTMLKGRWNEEIENLFKRVSGWEKGAEDWSRSWLYWGGGSKTSS